MPLLGGVCVPDRALMAEATDVQRDECSEARADRRPGMMLKGRYWLEGLATKTLAIESPASGDGLAVSIKARGEEHWRNSVGSSNQASTARLERLRKLQ